MHLKAATFLVAKLTTKEDIWCRALRQNKLLVSGGMAPTREKHLTYCF